MFDGILPTSANGERDRIFNSETRRALHHAARLLGMVVLGLLTAIVILSIAAATAILSVPWQLSLAVTAGAAVALPITVPYAMLRIYGLSHPDVVYVAKQAYREGAAEIVALSATPTASTVFDEAEAEAKDEGEREAMTDTDTGAAESTETTVSTETNQSTDSATTETEP